MELKDLPTRHRAVIRAFINSNEYLEIKDAFISHTPEGGEDGNREDNGMKNFGKLLGTRFVFNKLERLATQKPTQSKDKPKTEADENDRDLQ